MDSLPDEFRLGVLSKHSTSDKIYFQLLFSGGGEELAKHIRDTYASVHKHILTNLPESLPKDELGQVRYISDVIELCFKYNAAIDGLRKMTSGSSNKDIAEQAIIINSAVRDIENTLRSSPKKYG